MNLWRPVSIVIRLATTGCIKLAISTDNSPSIIYSGDQHHSSGSSLTRSLKVISPQNHEEIHFDCVFNYPGM